MVFKNTKAFSSFSVNDLEEPKKFYGQTLGLEVSESKEGLNLQFKGGNDVFIYTKPITRLRLLPYLIL
jgi:extradiol dioxygenase family protein